MKLLIKNQRHALLASALLMLTASPLYAGAGYITDTDNENNAGGGVADGDMDIGIKDTNVLHPIEFNIDMSGALPTTSAYLTLRTFDVDEEGGELDEVFFNGQSVRVSQGCK